MNQPEFTDKESGAESKCACFSEVAGPSSNMGGMTSRSLSLLHKGLSFRLLLFCNIPKYSLPKISL